MNDPNGINGLATGALQQLRGDFLYGDWRYMKSWSYVS